MRSKLDEEQVQFSRDRKEYYPMIQYASATFPLYYGIQQPPPSLHSVRRITDGVQLHSQAMVSPGVFIKALSCISSCLLSCVSCRIVANGVCRESLLETT